jgi:hypothetical protein
MVRFVLALWLAGCGGGQGADDPALPRLGEAMRAYDAGRAALKAGDAAGAATSFDAALALQPDDPLLRAWRARAWIAAGRAEEASRELDLLLSDHPAQHGARSDRALLRARSGRMEAAAQDLRDLITAGAITPDAIVRDPDWQAFRGAPELAFLPTSALRMTVSVPTARAYTGSEVTVRAEIAGLTSEPWRLEVEQASGPMALVKVVEEHSAESDGTPTARLLWTLRIAGAGTVNLRSWRLTQGRDVAVGEGASFEAGGSAAVAAAPVEMLVPSQLIGDPPLPRATWHGDLWVIGMTPGQRLAPTPSTARPGWVGTVRRGGEAVAQLAAFPNAHGEVRSVDVLDGGALVWRTTAAR